MSNVRDRLKAYIKSKNLGQKEFAKSIGASEGYVNAIDKSVGPDKIPIIRSLYPDLDIEWLLTGEGEMLRPIPTNSIVTGDVSGNGNNFIAGNGNHISSGIHEEDDPSITPTIKPEKYVPLLPITAQGGTLNDFVASIKPDECEKIISPIKGVDFAMTISGDSMEPEYPSGAKILIKRINEKAFIEWGRVYVLDTCNGSVIKRVMPSDTDTAVKCESINEKYPPFLVDFEDIHGMYRVLMLLSEK